MRSRAIVLISLLLAGIFAVAQIGDVRPSNPTIRIVSPKPNEKIASTGVTVRYELRNRQAVAAVSPNFQVSLDGADPSVTSTYDHTFTGLTPGQHRITIQLVDANNTPIAGGRDEVVFIVAPPGPGAAVAPTQNGDPRLVNASLQAPVEQTAAPAEQASPGASPPATADSPLPATGSALPLLSVIGFGILVGGIASALKTR